MKKKIMKAAIILIQLYALSVFTISAMIAMVIGTKIPVMGVGGVLVAAGILMVLSRGGANHDSSRDES